MISKPRYANGAMSGSIARLLAAPHVRRDHNTDEISWSPSDMELQLIELGLINREEKL